MNPLLQMIPSLLRRKLSWGLFALACAPLAPVAAQTASKPIKVVIPFAPGGGQDGIGRYFANQLTNRMGLSFIVENKTGAGGVIAADQVAKAAPDGTTLFLATGGAISIAPHLMSKMPYQARQDFVSIAMVADTPMAVAVRTSSPYRTLPDLVKAAKAQPEQITYASTGNGTVSHLTGELFAQAVGIKLSHVPYRGAAPAIVDVASGQIESIVTSAASLETMVAGGKMRVLATFTAAPIPHLAGVPTVQQATGEAGLVVPVWVGFMAPAKTPPAFVQRLSAELMAICQMPETQKRLLESGAQAACAGPADFDRVIAEDSQRWKRVIQRGNIKAE